MPGTVQFHRIITAPPERVYRAFTNAEAVAKWLPPRCHAAPNSKSLGRGFPT